MQTFRQILTLSRFVIISFLSVIDSDSRKLKNFDLDTVIPSDDGDAIFLLGGYASDEAARDTHLRTLIQGWDLCDQRASLSETHWISQLARYLANLADIRIQHVRDWIDANVARFNDGQRLPSIDEVYRKLEGLESELKVNVEPCTLQCSQCSLQCLKPRNHDASLGHDCATSHRCARRCEFESDHPDGPQVCGYP